MRRWVGVHVTGHGKATVMHARRGEALREATGEEVFPGTLNLDLDRDFDWESPHHEAVIPDAEDWEDIQGSWTTGVVRLWPVWVSEGGVCMPGWVMRMDRSGAPHDRVELLAAISIREALGGGPFTIEPRKAP